ncbi:hypothetical protein NPX13_g8901 [Xylaria arbuscula]|uniref:Uncharacterized protein n=1 Tax=Xylaria arbuscula TaxID=114810 RepID=A0A9W8THZ8_9PEZI|nr:hypothetical protein NPX13_g8901 [Xylaria arbuscula]
MPRRLPQGAAQGVCGESGQAAQIHGDQVPRLATGAPEQAIALRRPQRLPQEDGGADPRRIPGVLDATVS